MLAGVLAVPFLSLPAEAQGGGVTLFTSQGLSGESQTFFKDEPDLRFTRIGAGNSRSAGVARGCEAVLYEFPGYQGNYVKLRENDNNLDNTVLRQNSVGSIRVSCGSQSPAGGSSGFHPDEPQTKGWVSLHRDRRFRGAGQTFYDDVPNLNRTRVGSNTASSLRLAPGCTAILFEFENYRGRSTRLRDDEVNLVNTSVGEDRVSSLRLYCGRRSPDLDTSGPILGQQERYGVTLFRDRSLYGPSETFDTDIPDLSTTVFGARRASSVDVTPGCVATLFQFPYYRGTSVTVRERDNNLENTAVGEDTVSSLQVRCGSGTGGFGQSAPPAVTRGATLYRDRGATGPSQVFDRDIPDLSRTPIGSRTASSIDVSPGCVAFLYELPGYQGRFTTFKERDNNLANTDVGEDRASSLRIVCN
jgi:hypothetical protein